MLNAMGYQEPAEAQSIRSMLHIARLLALIFGILLLIGGIAYVAWIAYLASICATYIGFDPYCGGAIAGALIPAIYLAIAGVFLFLVWTQTKQIEAKVNSHQYEAAKSQTLLWMILGFIFGIILGVILLIAYLKFDPLINQSRAMASGQMPPPGAPPAWGAPPAPAPAPAPTAAAPPAAPPPGAQAAPFCGTCGKPTTYVPQYGRYYCYDCKQYV
ncbi:MAG TPA: hypothetical protein VEL82_06575 [Thermoplasmata archaeon]|nr:hypothetical protein [Thermoplasmata archaeon]